LARRREAPVSSEEEKNKALVRRFVEAQAEKDLAALEEMMAPDFVDHSVLPGQGTTREDYLQDVAEEQAASSDAQLSIEDQMAEDDKVITRLAIHGSHDQEMFTGVPPTGVELKSTCSSPASTPSSTPRAVDYSTPTLAMTCLTYNVEARLRN
jgi:predicted ester cyclase